MIQLPMPSFALIASQDVAFQVAFSVVVFLVLSSMVWTPAASSGEATSASPSEDGIADPEEDYLPREYQKPSSTPAEMEVLYRVEASEMPLSEWQELLYTPRQTLA